MPSGIDLMICVTLNFFFLWGLCGKPSTHQWCGLDKGGSRLGLSEELECCAGNLYSGNIQPETFCPECIGKQCLKTCDILQ